MSGNNRKKHLSRNQTKKQSQQKDTRLQLPVCSLCGKAIRNLTTAIANKDDGSPVHFDCIVKQLSDQEELSNNEKICYLGGGSFGVVRQKPGSGSKNFFIRKRIQFEMKENVLEWRKNISSTLLGLH